jgi:hypothetical protein
MHDPDAASGQLERRGIRSATHPHTVPETFFRKNGKMRDRRPPIFSGKIGFPDVAGFAKAKIKADAPEIA